MVAIDQGFSFGSKSQTTARLHAHCDPFWTPFFFTGDKQLKKCMATHLRLMHSVGQNIHLFWPLECLCIVYTFFFFSFCPNAPLLNEYVTFFLFCLLSAHVCMDTQANMEDLILEAKK